MSSSCARSSLWSCYGDAVPSRVHQAIVELFRERPTLAPEVLAGPLGVEVPSFVRALPVDADRDKPFTWPAYLAVLRSRRRSPVCLLVVTPDADIARWAAAPIGLGPGMGEITPRVLGPREVPLVVDASAAERNPELAVLSALAHGDEPGADAVLTAAVRAVAVLDAHAGAVYLQVIWDRLGPAMRDALEKAVMKQFPQGEMPDPPPFLQRYIDAGMARGMARSTAEAILSVLDARGISVPEDVRVQVLACTDTDVLKRWLRRAATMKSARSVVRAPKREA